MKGEKNGGGAGTRTPDTGIMIPLLYQLSYTATCGRFRQEVKILYPPRFVKGKYGMKIQITKSKFQINSKRQ